ncbi:MAG: hypothetical protein ACTSU6_04825 [Candidatus Njordarchaeales archaeon]
MLEKKEEIKKFLTQKSEQNNRCTAAPYFYVIRSKIEVPAHDGCGDHVRYFDPENAEDSFDSIEEYVTKMKEWHEYDDMIGDDKIEFDERMQNAEYNLSSYNISYDWKESGMFLTETDAKDHLKSNHYHYSSDAHTYIKHSWRAPELKEFFAAMFNYFEIPRGNLDIHEIEK